MSSNSTLIADLASDGWTVTQDFLPVEAVAALAEEARGLQAASRFRQAGVGRGPGHVVRPEVRGDQITWLDEHSLTPAQARYWAEIEALRRALNQELFLGLDSFEAHYAVYPPGAGYQRHLDCFASSNTRAISCSLYLNADWHDGLGGQLRLHLPDRFVDIVPCAGTLVLFRSEAIPHEVLPASQHRFSLTGWFRRRALRPAWP
ncbi:MAG TPA: 2OG-Fe(II) oxygenase [Candidatus Methylomirabilis sp.]|nr:2OG-Fe(II) oxygenase [Candidatus Methylomirabilis sp.]